MPPAARITDTTGHGPPLSPGPGSLTVSIGFLPAWRALPSGVSGGLEQASNTMKSLMSSPALTPPDATAKLAQVQAGLMQSAGAAVANGNPAAIGTVSGAIAGLTATNAGLTATYAAASAVPGGQPAATQAYTQGIKAAAAGAASSAVSAIAGQSDLHICPIPCPIPPHGPGLVAKASTTVEIDGLPAVRQGDKVIEACGGADPISKGDVTVDIG